MTLKITPVRCNTDTHMDKGRIVRHSARMKTLRAGLIVLALAAAFSTAFAFNGHKVTEGPLAISIADIATVTNHDAQALVVKLSNSGPTAVTVEVELTGLADECRAVGGARRSLSVPGSGAAEARFQFVAGQGAYSALYPVHIKAAFQDGSQQRVAHAIQIFQTDFSALEKAASAARAQPVLAVPASGVLALANSKDQLVTWRVFKTDATGKTPVGWQGGDAETGTSFSRDSVDRGGTRRALQVHPPYRTGAGTMFVEYRLKLPQAKPISLEFFNAIRDHGASEPPSDGVTFRAWISEKMIFERHTDSKVWLPGRASLDEWAGQEVVLKLEGHPGPRRDTTCDSAFWGDPVVRAGTPSRQLTATERESLNARARAAIGKRHGSEGVFLFELNGGSAVAIAPGPNGITDAAIAFGNGEKAVVFEGVNISLFDQPVGGAVGLTVSKVSTTPEADGKLRIAHTVALPDGPAQVVVEAWRESGGLRLKLSSAARISDLAIGRADQPAPNVYYGHGYCVIEPGKFRAGGGGHNLATSHVGFDFAGGVSLLMACDTPPDDFQVDSVERLYTLHTHPDTTFTFVPGTNGAMECALRYRPLYDKQPAPAVRKKAGRFVFDIWGGRYADDARLLQRCFDYGLTNSLALMHVWQRWGYDYRLPDIFPPLPSLGTVEDLRDLGRVCDAAGVLWGLHDNYIDIYPDATGFSYDHVTFDSQGRPRKAWLNEGRDAQSYQFRPDHVRPFLDHNLGLMAPALKPSASFVDVWTSINAFDYHDRQGNFHSKVETLRCWGEAFARIRDSFGGAPTSSEAGSDQLIGWLDGADCQFLRIGEGRFNNSVPCRDWARVPWFDLVNHTRFSLHGVGYSDRYQGSLSREDHGIESDDYLGAEILTGHALMMDLHGMVRGAVRKYWLAQDFIESVALDEIQGVEIFTAGREPMTAPAIGAGSEAPHRLRVRWNSGAEAWVNRGTNDWHVAGKVLPPCGFYAHDAGIETSVERIGGVIIEQSRAPGRFYVNGRGFNPNAPLAIRPEARPIERLGGRDFRLVVDWRAEQGAPKDLAVFYHFSQAVAGRYTDAEFYGGGIPAVPTSKWAGKVVTGTNWVVHVPEGMPLGEYDVLVGLYDERGDGRRYRLAGEEVAGRRYRVGKLVVEGSVSGGATNITGLRLERRIGQPASQPGGSGPRLNQPVQFAVVETAGAVRLLTDPQGVTVIPLPDGDDFEVRLNVSALLGSSARVGSVHAINSKGVKDHQTKYAEEAGHVRFKCEAGAFGYRIDRQP